MNIDFININTYLENKEENVFIKSFYYSAIIGVLLILVIVISSYKKKNTYYENILYIENNEIVLTVKYNELERIINNKEIIINDKKYTYKINNIGINNGDMEYKINILLSDQNFLYNNVFTSYRILLNEESFWKYIVRTVKGE